MCSMIHVRIQAMEHKYNSDRIRHILTFIVSVGFEGEFMFSLEDLKLNEIFLEESANPLRIVLSPFLILLRLFNQLELNFGI